MGMAGAQYVEFASILKVRLLSHDHGLLS